MSLILSPFRKESNRTFLRISNGCMTIASNDPEKNGKVVYGVSGTLDSVGCHCVAVRNSKAVFYDFNLSDKDEHYNISVAGNCAASLIFSLATVRDFSGTFLFEVSRSKDGNFSDVHIWKNGQMLKWYIPRDQWPKGQELKTLVDQNLTVINTMMKSPIAG